MILTAIGMNEMIRLFACCYSSEDSTTTFLAKLFNEEQAPLSRPGGCHSK